MMINLACSLLLGFSLFKLIHVAFTQEFRSSSIQITNQTIFRRYENINFSTITKNRLELAKKSQQLIVGFVIQPPYEMPCYIVSKKQCPKPGPGRNIEMFSLIENLLKEPVTVVLADQNQYGYFSPADQQWHGLIRQLSRNEINMTGTLLTVRHAWHKIIDYSIPVGYWRWAYLINIPPRTYTQFQFHLAQPFSPVVWICILCTFVLMMLIFPILTINVSSVSDFVREAEGLAKLLMNPDLIARANTPTRLIRLAIWSGFSAYMMVVYKSMLTVTAVPMAVAPPFSSLSELADLIAAGRFRIADSEHGFFINEVPYYGTEHTEKFRKALEVNPPILTNSYDEARKLVETTDNVVFAGSVSGLTYYAMRKCNLSVIVDKDATGNWLAFGFPKNSSLKVIVNHLLIWPLNNTAFQAFETTSRRYIPKERHCPKPKMELARVGLTQIIDLLWIYFIGILVSILGLTLETRIRRKKVLAITA